jgi:urea transporter
MAIGQIVLTLIAFFLGYQTDKINQGTWFGFVPLIYAIAVYWLGQKAVREEDAGKYLTYGKGVSTGLMIAIYSGLIGAIYTYVHYSFVNPNFADYLIEASRTKWVAAGMSDTQMEGAEKGMRMFTKPAIQAVFFLIIGIVLGLIISLITAAFLRRTPPEEGQVAS